VAGPARAERGWTWATRALLLVLAGVALATFADYGITVDDGVQHRLGRRLLRWYASLGNEPRVTDDDVDNARYGGLAEMVVELVVRVSPLETYASRHLANVGFAFVAFLAVVRIARGLGGPRGAFLALLSLALSPPFYGNAFFNSKDVPFAALFALAVGGILACDAWPGTSWGRALGAGALVGLASAVRVGGLVLFGFALALWLGTLLLRGDGGRPAWPSRKDLLRLLAAWSVALAAGWTVMVTFWPWAMQDPLRNPFRAAERFSHFWAGMLVYYDGRLLPAGQVSRFYLPNWFALTLPEHLLVAGGLGLVGLVLLVRARRLGPGARLRLLQAGWLASIPALVVAGVVARRMPLYDGMRHFLFLVPLLAVLAGVSVSVFLRSPAPRAAKAAGVAVLAAASLVTLVDMVRLHPYQSVHFNRLWAGGLEAGVDRYEGDYWCLSYKEGCEWLLRRYAGARCREKVRVAGYSVLHQVQHYLELTEEGRRLFRAVAVADGRPHFVMATTRFQDHLRAPGKPVHTVERMGATLFYLFEVDPPDCELP
jgi:hypothetical protein